MDKELPRQEEAKGVHLHQTSNVQKVKGSSLRRKRKLKNINNKMVRIHTYQQLNLKNKIYKQAEQKQNHRYRECFKGARWEGGQRDG